MSSAIQLIKKDQKLAERTFDQMVERKRIGEFEQVRWKLLSDLFKPTPYVPDKGIETVLKDLANRRPVPKEFIGHPELFRDNGPLERALPRS